MVSKSPQFSLRIPKEQLEKLRYIADYNARSINKEVEFLIRNYIQAFEGQHGTIAINKKEAD